MTYTQFKPDDWSTYATDDWLTHYDKVLLPWQTENNVLNGQYYSQLDTSYNGNPSVKDTLLTFMNSGGTVQMHLGPYSDGPHNAYLNNKLPFGIDVVDRDTSSSCCNME